MTTQDKKSNKVEEIVEEFSRGYYSFRFEYTDKDGNRRFEVGYWNDGMKPEEALRKIALHVSEYEDGKITDFIDNRYFREKIASSYEQGVRDERERQLDMWNHAIVMGCDLRETINRIRKIYDEEVDKALNNN